MACWARMQSSSLRCSASVPSYVHGKIASNTRLSCIASFGRPLKLVALKSGRHKNRKGLPLPVVTATLGLEESSDGDGVADATNGRNVVEEAKLGQQGQSMEVDTVTEAELKENGFRSMQRTKLICTIDPATCAPEQLEVLAMGGMNVAKLNMCHGTCDWHTQVICNVCSLNSEKGYSVAVMMDIEGREIHMGDFNGAPSVKAEDGEEWIFTVRKLETLPDYTAIVNYNGFAEDVRVGDELVVDGEMVRFEVKEKVGPDVKCKCIDHGLLLPRANLTFWREGQLVQERNATLPTISSKDWIDIDFGIAQGVDFIAVSFVKTSEDIKHLKSYIRARSPNKSIGVFVKIESNASLKNLEDIIRVSDGAMVARGDLGAQVPLEQVPSVQQTIVNLCQELDKPVIVASQLLESMIEFPAPTRAEVVDVSEGVILQAYFDPNSNEAWHAPPVKSFQMDDGTCVDCIPIEGQIAAHHPLLKDHVIQMAPSRGPQRPLESHPQAFAREHGGCPEGTIPVLRDDPIGKFMKKVAPPRRAPTPVGIENPALDADIAKHEYAITSIPRVPS